MLGIIFSFLFILFIFIYKEICFFPFLFLKNKDTKIRKARIYLREMSVSLLKILNIKVNIKYKNNFNLNTLDKKQNIVIIANHQSNFDIPVLLSVFKEFDIGFVAKKEMETWPFFSRWMKRGNYIFLNRKNAREGIKSIKQAVSIVNSGYPTVIFPEGERSTTGKITKFKKGSFKLPLDSKSIIIPVTINGTFDIQRKNSPFISLNKKVSVTIDAPINLKNKDLNFKKNIHLTVEKIIKENF
ncbi:MAG: lysophospholipid acyltransferase family protein [Fusobacterium sp. JB021]|nr:lysophospholipid acyltransferase family protein [Fusobacterium sp. JB021]MDP0505596.1 lysophospholipid acyltransferase family protein [Fusobacterium sp. JB019]